jgi:ribosome-binding protein aMBF1 (putative translation factor)
MAKKNHKDIAHDITDNQNDKSAKINSKKGEKISGNVSIPKKERKQIPVTQNLKSAINQYVIDIVRDKRKALKLSQTKLAIAVGFTESYVGHCENPNRPEKYNLDHINILAAFFKCSIKDFFPDEPFKVSVTENIL